jgi:hypothetical protein
MAKKTKEIQDFVKAKAGATSVRILGSDGELHASKAAGLYKAIGDLNKSTEYGDVTTTVGGAKVYKHPIDKKTLLLGFHSNAYHYRACKIKSEYIAGSSYSLIDESETAKGKFMKLWSKAVGMVRQKEDAAIVRFIDALGYDDYIVNILCDFALDMEWSGDGYLEVIRDASNNIRKTRHIPALNVWKKVGGGFIEYKNIVGQKKTTHYRDFGVVDEKIQTGKTEMIHIRNKHPLSEVYGVPDIANAWSALSKCVLIDENHESFFYNNSVPAMVVILEGGEWEDGADEVIKNHLRDNVKGKDHKTLVLNIPTKDSKIRFEPLGLTLKEGNFLQLKKEARAEVFTADGVPPAKAGIVETGALAGESTQEQIDDFENAISKKQFRIQDVMDKIIHAVFPDTTYYYKVIGIGSRVTKQQIQSDAMDVISTTNELRSARGYEPSDHPDADTPRVLLGVGVMPGEPAFGNTDQTAPNAAAA